MSLLISSSLAALSPAQLGRGISESAPITPPPFSLDSQRFNYGIDWLGIKAGLKLGE
jgi:hypothetical protein